MRHFYAFLLAAFAMIFASNISAQTNSFPKEIIPGSDNVVSIVVQSTNDLAKIPVTVFLTNPNTDITSLEASLIAPVDVHKFVYDDEDEDFVYEKTSRWVKGHIPTMNAGTEEHGADAFFISIADSKTRNFKQNEGAIITVFFDGSELGEGEYAVQMIDAISVAVGDLVYTSPNMSAAFTVTEGVVIGTEGEAPMAKSLTVAPESVTLTSIEETTLTATITPSVSSQELEWESSDPSVITVDGEGNIFPLKNGTATITAATTDGSELTAECEVTVEVPAIFEVTATTQTTATITANGTAVVADAQVVINDEEYTAADGTVTVEGLAPGETYTATVITTLDDYTWTEELTVQTKDIEISKITFITPTTITLDVSYDAGDATVTRASFSTTAEIDKINATKLVPATVYTYNYYITTEEGGMKAYPIEVSTKPFGLRNPNIHVVKIGEVVVKFESDLFGCADDLDLGFEWRRLGEEVSRITKGYLYDGYIEGTVSDLTVGVDWEVRAYYKAEDGQYTYGGWESFNPEKASAGDPTVQNFAPEVQGTTALLKAIALPGTVKALKKGFKIWPNITFNFSGPSPKYPQTTQVPAYATTILVDGELMRAEFTGLQYELEYTYVAFVETEDNEVFYSEEEKFFVPDPTGLHSAETTAAIEGNVKVYDLSGSLVFKGNKADMNLNKGIYIVRPAVGKAQKIVVK